MRRTPASVARSASRLTALLLLAALVAQACGGDASGVNGGGAGSSGGDGGGTSDGAGTARDGGGGEGDGASNVDGALSGDDGGDGSAAADGGGGDGSVSGDGSTDGAGPGDGASDGAGSGDGATGDGGPAANPVAGENALTGTTAWMLTNPATGREIEGYPSAPSVAPGQSLSLFVSTASAKYTLTVYRLGWYGGAGGREVAAAVERDGHLQVTPTPDADGLVECNWIDPHTFTVPAGWVSGVYVARLKTKDTGKESFVPFVVRDDVRAATYLVQSSVTTFQAYNNWGGKSLYDFNSTGPRASRVSFLRPYAMGENPLSAPGVGAGELLTNLQGATHTAPMGWEYPMVRFLEREGYDVSYVTNVDVHRDATLVSRHKVFLSVGHDEYWSSEMRDHVEHARDRGTTSLGFFSGNVAHWQVRFEPSKTAKPNATLVCFKDETKDPIYGTANAYQTTVRSDSAILSRTEAGLTGVAFQDYDVAGDLVVADANAWPFSGTGLSVGDKLTGLLGYEVEGFTEPPLPGVRPVFRSPWTTVRGAGTSHGVIRRLPSAVDAFAAGSIQLPWGVDNFRFTGITQPLVSNATTLAVARNILAQLAATRPKEPDRTALLLDEPFTVTLAPDRFTPRAIVEGAAAFDPLVIAAVQSGRLVVTPRASVTGLHHGGVVTARTYAMTCGAAQVELVQATNAASAADTTFAVVADPANWMRITQESGQLVFGLSVAGALSSSTLAYSAAQHRFLRLRHDCVADVLRFETSADGLSWTTRRSTSAAPSVVRAAYVELEAGTYKSEAAPGQAIFDNLRVETMGLFETFATQRDPETLTPDAIHEGGYDPLIASFFYGGRFTLRPRPGVTGQHHMGLASTRAIDWTGGIARVTLHKAPNAASEASVSLAVMGQLPGWVRTTVSAGKIFFQLQDLQRNQTSVSIPFDVTAHKFIRIRHDVAPDQLVWETSPDGSAWVERRRVARIFGLADSRAEIEGGTYQSEASPGEIIVDDFVFAR